MLQLAQRFGLDLANAFARIGRLNSANSEVLFEQRRCCVIA
jgi:hypothetical protein